MEQVFKCKLVRMNLHSFYKLWKDPKMHKMSTDIPYHEQSGAGLQMPRAASDETNRKRWHMLHSVNFLGDLFAMGILSVQEMRDVVVTIATNPRSFLHLRGLHLLLSRCVYVTGQRLDSEFLLQTRQEIISRLWHVPNAWVQRWRAEMENLIERMLDQLGQDKREEDQIADGQVVKHQWSRSLSAENVFAPVASWVTTETQA
ncbi:hypothetical protein NM688_g1586 [Phlebia brevispora]|uniref:Uncharacterized protein n=1 Tax=Phlebia brevispora TaxID=194682 RepID=A0ACC1TAS2_9APHY|nr:hypothetical protein NM688_g1586 [Phlebia brevispora]